MINIDALEVRRKLFQDFCNHRDRIRKLTHNPRLQLNLQQEKQVLQMARKSFRQREWGGTADWFGRFFRDVGIYFDTLKTSCWPSLRKK